MQRTQRPPTRHPLARIATRSVLLASIGLVGLTGLLCGIGASSVAAAAIDVTATIRPRQVAIAQRAQVTVLVSGTTRSEQPEFTDVEDLDVLYVGPTTQFSSLNGSVTQSVSYRYLVSAHKPGRYRLGPFRVRMGSNTFTSEPVELEVLAQPRVGAAAGSGAKATAGSGGAQAIALMLDPAKKTAYVGERVPLSVRLIVGSERIDQVQYPQIGGDGFAVEDFAEPLRSVERIRGQSVRVLDFRTHLTALRAGTLDLGPATMEVTVVDQRRSQNDLFGLDFGFGRRRNVTLRSQPVELTVRPLPVSGRPDGFSGALGQFDFTLTAAPTVVNAGDPVTVRIDVRGVGNLAGLVPPAVPASDQLRTYEPLVLREETSVDHFAAEQVVIPLSTDVEQVPVVAFSFFDPEIGEYQTITRGPVPLRVASAPGAVRSQVIVDGNAGDRALAQEELGRDIVYIKDHPGSLRAGDRRPPWTRSWFLVSALLPVAAFFFAVAYVRRRDRFAADPRLRRFRDAGRTARAGLAELRRRTEADGSFYDELSSLVRTYLAAKLDLPPGAVDKSRVLRTLADGVATPKRSAAAQARIAELFDLLERVHYAGAMQIGDRDAAMAMAADVVAALEADKQLLRRLGPSARTLISLAVLAAVGAMLTSSGTTAVAAGAPAGVDPLTSFYQGNAAYKEGRYDVAIEQYLAAVAAAGHSAPIDYNLGNAYFKADRIGPAILWYERALRSAPRDPDIRTNLAFALETAEVERHATPLWARLAFPLATRATTGELAILLVVLWWASWSVAIVRLFAPTLRSGIRTSIWIVAAVTLLVGANLVVRVWTIDNDALGVVVATGDAVVRYEPTQSGVEYYRAPEGALLSITSEREGWLQVRRDDGLRGWMRTRDLERL